MSRLGGKVALITGGSKGIGREIAIRFKEEGAGVVITYNSSKEMALTLEKGGIKIVKCDVTKRNEVKGAIEFVKKEFGRLDILVNNAGIMLNMPFEDFDENKVRKMIDTNIMGVIYSTLESLEMLKKSHGKIINIASNAGIGTAFSNTTFYSMTKASVINLTKRMAFDFSKYGVRVNSIAPGWIETDLTTYARTPEETERIKNFLEKSTTIGRYGKVDDISKVAVFLASDESDYINGQVLLVDGGRTDYLAHSI
ncbi:MAG: glucose 1-dehydrogenase [Thermoplasmata archaeon]